VGQGNVFPARERRRRQPDPAQPSTPPLALMFWRA
jgi:hypothetical protein